MQATPTTLTRLRPPRHAGSSGIRVHSRRRLRTRQEVVKPAEGLSTGMWITISYHGNSHSSPMTTGSDWLVLFSRAVNKGLLVWVRHVWAKISTYVATPPAVTSQPRQSVLKRQTNSLLLRWWSPDACRPMKSHQLSPLGEMLLF